MLSYSAYIRHRNPLTCPGKTNSSQLTCSTTSSLDPDAELYAAAAESLDFEEQSQLAVDRDEHVMNSDNSDGDTHSETDFETESSASTDEFDQDEVEVLSSSSSTSDNEFEAVDHEEVLCGVASVNAAPVSSNNPHPCSDESPAHSNPHVDPFVHFFCLFMSFFQLCYKVSDRGLTLLLVFINVMLTWIATLIPSPYRDTIKAIKDKVPKNVYFFKKKNSI